MSHLQPTPSSAAPVSRPWTITPTCIVLILYAAFLTRGISQPWTGLHDWNGAFYSQLARNLLRYPFDLHHGMPVVAVGPALPADGEWSFYATHPPGLVWCIAASFQIFGEHEWAARLVPLLASLATIALLMRAVAARCGEATACVTGVIYALLPMNAYFGRMPDQEAPCLFLMLAALLAADALFGPPTAPSRRLRPGFVWSFCIFAAIWIDWVALIPAGLVSIRALIELARGRIAAGRFARIVAAPIAATISMLSYLVYFGFAGRWADLVAVFNSRAGVTVDSSPAVPHGTAAWTHTVENLTLPVMLLAAVGMAFLLLRKARSFKPDERPVPFTTGMTVLAATGVLWVGLFWRQYLVHQYWLAYLGPGTALLAAMGILEIHAWASARAPRAARAILVFIMVIGSAFASVGINSLYERVHIPVVDIQAWQSARREVTRGLGPDHAWTSTPPPVLLLRAPIRLEQRGGYVLRNIVPPHFAYYFDFPFEVEPSLEQVAARLPGRAGFLIPTRDAVSLSQAIASQLGPVEHHSYGSWQLFMAP